MAYKTAKTYAKVGKQLLDKAIETGKKKKKKKRTSKYQDIKQETGIGRKRNGRKRK